MIYVCAALASLFFNAFWLFVLITLLNMKLSVTRQSV